jgi:hypothetical protein
MLAAGWRELALVAAQDEFERPSRDLGAETASGAQSRAAAHDRNLCFCGAWGPTGFADR